MIARVWRGWARPPDVAAYEAHFREAVLPHLERIDGFRGARLLRREDGDEVEVMAITWFESMDSVRSFAGDDVERAVVEPAARAVLTRWDDCCVHYEVAVST
jgi:heme-degrading monooxygenase HmoA